MGKKHKTREQKILADKRRQQFFSHESPVASQSPQLIKSPSLAETKSSLAVSYTPDTPFVPFPAQTTTPHIMYIAADLHKIAFLTSGIVIAQLILYYIVTRGIFTIPGIHY